jgi:hypothetical protein
MLIIADNVCMVGVKPEIIPAIMAAEKAYAEYGADCIITSCTGGKHSHKSLHYKGYAVDFRTMNVNPSVAESVAMRLKNALGNNYDVVLEKDHLHIEYDPRFGVEN